MNSFGDAQAGSVAGSQNRPMLGATYAAQKVEYLLRAQDHGQLLRPLRRGEDVTRRVQFLLERDLIQKSQRGDGDRVSEPGRELLLVGQVNLVGRGSRFGAQQASRGLRKRACEQGDLLQSTRFACSGRDSAPACLRSCVAEENVSGGLLCAKWICCTAAPPYFRRRKLTNPADGTAYGLKAVPPITA